MKTLDLPTHIILGGGLGGLSTAFYAAQNSSILIKLYESSNRIGGWINSFKTKSGSVFETGPRTIKSDSKFVVNTLQLCTDLGLKPLIIPINRKSVVSRNKYLYVNNQIVKLPTSFSSVFRIKPPYMKPLWRAWWQDTTAPKKVVDDDSVYDFASRRFGDDFAEIPISAWICGIFAGDAKEISVKSVLPKFFEYEQQYGSVFKGVRKDPNKRIDFGNFRNDILKWYAWSFKDGMETLPIKLKEYLNTNQRADIHLGKKCSYINFKHGKAYLTVNEEKVEADHLYSALPAKELAKILPQEHNFLKNELQSIPYVHVGVVNLEYNVNLLQGKEGFGVLVPPNQNLPILGITYDSCALAQNDKTVLTVMMGGKWFEQYFGSNPDQETLLRTAQEHVGKILEIHEAPIESRVSILKNCIPQYIVGHSKKVHKIREYIKENKLPLSLVGNAFDGIGIHDVINTAKVQVENVLPNTESIGQ